VRQERNLYKIRDKLQSSKVYVKRGERERGMSTCKWEDNIEMNLREQGVKVRSQLSLLVVNVYKRDGVILVS
jgi:hypothetical protein